MHVLRKNYFGITAYACYIDKSKFSFIIFIFQHRAQGASEYYTLAEYTMIA